MASLASWPPLRQKNLGDDGSARDVTESVWQSREIMLLCLECVNLSFRDSEVGGLNEGIADSGGKKHVAWE